MKPDELIEEAKKSLIWMGAIHIAGGTLGLIFLLVAVYLES